MYPLFKKIIRKIKRQLTPVNAGNIFGHQYLESKALFLQRFKQIPCLTLIDDIDVTKAFAH
jgi:hypothetical protein